MLGKVTTEGFLVVLYVRCLQRDREVKACAVYNSNLSSSDPAQIWGTEFTLE